METKYPRLVVSQQQALAVVRIFIGAFFLYALSTKLNTHFVPEFFKVVKPMAAHTPFAWYAGFLKDTVIPNHQAFAYLVLVGELIVGAGLALGLFTAPIALLGAFMNLNYLFATAGQGMASVGLNLTFVVVQLALAWGYAGTTWGVDRTLVGRTPHWFQGLKHYEYREF